MLGGGELEDVVAFISGQSEVYVAVNSAYKPSLGLVRNAEVRQNLPPLQISGRS